MRLAQLIQVAGFIGLASLSSSPLAQSSGTAFAVTPNLLITNHHVIDGCSTVEVVGKDGRRPVIVVDAEEQIDLALLRVYGLRGGVANIRKSKPIQLGEQVMVFGFPLSGSLSSTGNFTSGLVSSLRGLRDAAGEIQITAPVQPGNSGGPVLDGSGSVIAVVQSKLDAVRAIRTTGDIPQNVNFAVSLDVLMDFLDKNNVKLAHSVPVGQLDSVKIAELAQGFTYKLECQKKAKPSAQADASSGQLRRCAGEYSAATWTNCTGSRVFDNGNKYSGSFLSGVPNGKGMMQFPDGSKYSGDFDSGAISGRGTIEFSNGHAYSGEVLSGYMHGQGTFTFEGGDKYVGSFQKDLFDGNGTYTFKDGRTYKGNYKNDKRNGYGVFSDRNGEIVFAGMWIDGKPSSAAQAGQVSPSSQTQPPPSSASASKQQPQQVPQVFQNSDLNLMIAAAYNRNTMEVERVFGKFKLNANPQRGDRVLARKLNAEGLAAFKKENYPSAAVLFRQGSEADAGDAELINNYAYALQRQGNYRDSIPALEKTLFIAIDRPSAWFNLYDALAAVNLPASACGALSLGLKFVKVPEQSISYLEDQISKETDASVAKRKAEILDCARARIQ